MFMDWKNSSSGTTHSSLMSITIIFESDYSYNLYFYFYQGGDYVRFKGKQMLPLWLSFGYSEFNEGLGTVELERFKSDCLIGDYIPRM